MPTSKKVLLIGNGVAGPTTAIALKRAGIEAVIYEAYPGPGDAVGSFLGITQNGQDVLETLGVQKAVLKDGYQTNGFHFANSAGKSLGIVPASAITIKRGNLTKALREKALKEGVKIEWGKRLKNIRVADEHTVVAQFEDGSEATGNVLIGADGIHSRTRALTFPKAPQPTFTGLISCGAYATNTGLPSTGDTAQMIFGKRAFFSYMVKPSGEVYWFANVDSKATPQKGEVEARDSAWWHAHLEELFAGDQPFINDIIKKSSSDILGFPVFDLASIPRWHEGPICLIGDAAHAPSPSAGQGASLALEDGLVLAQCLRDISDTSLALDTFVALRKERAERVVAQSRRNGRRKTPTTFIGRLIRDLMLPIIIKQGGDATKWMYSYHIDWDKTVTPTTR